jgi:hypothetical protein
MLAIIETPRMMASSGWMAGCERAFLLRKYAEIFGSIRLSWLGLPVMKILSTTCFSILAVLRSLLRRLRTGSSSSVSAVSGFWTVF